MIGIEALHVVTRCLGIADDALIDTETPSVLAGTFTVSGTNVASLARADIENLVTTYLGTVQLIIKLGELEEFVVAQTFDPTELNQLVANAAAAPEYQVIIRVEKPVLIARMSGNQSKQTVLFFHCRAAVAALSSGLRAIERDLWTNPTEPLNLLIVDCDAALNGDLLTVRGGTQLSEAPADPTVRHSGVDPALAARRRDDYIGWDAELDTRLTPWHFSYSSATGNKQLLAQIDTVFVTAAILFTCDRARAVLQLGAPAKIQAEFRGREHVAFVPIDASNPCLEISDTQRASIRQLVDWCYQSQTGEAVETDWLADRLPFVQTRVAQALAGRDEATRFQIYATAMPEILEGARWQWRAFLEGRVSDYLDGVQKLEETVASTADQYADRTNKLVDGLSASILAAVAALIGSFIAAAYKDPFNATLFRIGMFTYAGYVLIFPGILASLAARGYLKQIDRSFGAQRTQFEQALYPDKVTEIIGTRIKSARDRYDRWWCAVVTCYAAISIAACIAAVAVPNHLT